MKTKPGCDEAANRLLGFGSHEPLPCEQAKDHGAQSGNEAKGKVAAAVECERVFAGKQVQEPQIKGLAKIAVLVPVRAKAGVQMMPVGGNADRRIIEVRAR